MHCRIGSLETPELGRYLLMLEKLQNLKKLKIQIEERGQEVTYVLTKYRKKPLVIEAMRIPELKNQEYEDLRDWLDDKASANGRSLWIHTIDGDMVANPGDWIIRGVDGEFYPCTHSVFKATYEEV